MLKIYKVVKTDLAKKTKFYRHYWFIFLASAFAFGSLLFIGISQYNSYQKELAYDSMIRITKAKHESLEKFISNIADSANKQDWSSIYDAQPEIVRQNVSKEEYISVRRKIQPTFYSITIGVKNIQLIGNKGVVKETIVGCLDKNCSGESRIEAPTVVQFVYTNGKWNFPDEKPSKESLTIASELYINWPIPKLFVEHFGEGFNSTDYAIAHVALSLDQNSGNLAQAKALLNKIIEDKKAKQNSELIECHINKGVTYTNTQQDCEYLKEAVKKSNSQNMTQFYQQSKIPEATPLIDCTGPDGKHLQLTQQDCDDFNNAWKPTQAPQGAPSYSYSYSSPIYYPIYSNPKWVNSSYPTYSSGAEETMQNFQNNLWNIVNTASMENQITNMNYQLQEINNALRY